MAGVNITVDVPKVLLEQICRRSQLNNRFRNEEFRYLLDYALEAAGEDDVEVVLPDDAKVKIVVRVSFNTREIIEDRARRFHRRPGRELLLLSAYALHVSRERDLRVIEEMMRRQGPAAA